MREILFRGKRIDNGEWVEGFYVRTGQHYFIFSGTLDITGLYPTFERYEVDPDTVGQYTGLYDKNGKRIFKGDILGYWNGEEYSIYSVVWDYYRWLVQMHEGYECDPDDLDESFCKDAEVIGNIHDN